MTASSDLLDPASVAAALQDLSPDWSGSVETLSRSIRFADFPTAVQFIDELAAVCEEREHHPDFVLSYDTVEVSLSTHSAGGVTRKDVELAYEVDRVAATLPWHASPDPDDRG